MPEAHENPAAKRRKISLEYSKGLVPLFEHSDNHAAWFRAFASRHHENAAIRAHVHANSVLINIFELCVRKSIAAKNHIRDNDGGNNEREPGAGPLENVANNLNRTAGGNDNEDGDQAQGVEGNENGHAEQKQEVGSLCEGVRGTILKFMGMTVGSAKSSGKTLVLQGTAAKCQMLSRLRSQEVVDIVTEEIVARAMERAEGAGGGAVTLQCIGQLPVCDKLHGPLQRDIRSKPAKDQWRKLLASYPGIAKNLEVAGFHHRVFQSNGKLKVYWRDALDDEGDSLSD